MDANTDFSEGYDDVDDDFLATEFAESEAQQELLAELEALKKGQLNNEKPTQN